MAGCMRSIILLLGKPSTGRIAVKVINHLGDEVMKVSAVQARSSERVWERTDAFSRTRLL
jgi:hypothetical protein